MLLSDKAESFSRLVWHLQKFDLYLQKNRKTYGKERIT